MRKAVKAPDREDKRAAERQEHERRALRVPQRADEKQKRGGACRHPGERAEGDRDVERVRAAAQIIKLGR